MSKIQADPGFDGDLSLATCAGVIQLNLAANNDSQQKTLLPILHDAKLITMHGNGMLFRGIERRSDGAEWVQEWSVRMFFLRSRFA